MLEGKLHNSILSNYHIWVGTKSGMKDNISHYNVFV